MLILPVRIAMLACVVVIVIFELPSKLAFPATTPCSFIFLAVASLLAVPSVS